MIYRALLMDQDSIPKPLVHYNFEEYTNDNHPAQIPDLMGSGYNLNYNNISFNLMSGFGGYLLDFSTFSANMSVNDHTSRVSLDTVGSRWLYGKRIADGDSYIPSHIVKVTGVPNDTTLYYHRVVEGNTVDIMSLSQDGIYLLPESQQATGEVTGGTYVGVYAIFREGTGEPFTITVEQLPLYPGCFVLDVKNTVAYLRSTSLNPFNRRITIIIKRNPKLINLDEKLDSSYQEHLLFLSSNFNMESTASGLRRIFDFGVYTQVTGNKYIEDNIAYTTSQKYGKDTNLVKGDNNTLTDLYLGSTNVDFSYNNAISEIYIWDKDLTQSQIDRFISENMVPDPLVYYDVRKQNTKNIDEHSRGTLIDLSGNGNHGTLNNFDYTEDSGWVETYIDDTFPIIESDNLSYENHLITTTTAITNSTFFRSSILDSEGDKEKVETGFQMKSYRIKVSGLGTGSFRIGYFYRIYSSQRKDMKFLHG